MMSRQITAPAIASLLLLMLVTIDCTSQPGPICSDVWPTPSKMPPDDWAHLPGFPSPAPVRCRNKTENGPPAAAAAPLACVEGHSSCQNISDRCRERQCPADTACGLDVNETIVCFPDSVRQSQNCADEDTRLTHPCSPHSQALGFGSGCTFCVGIDSSDPVTTGLPVIAGTAVGPAQQAKACLVEHDGGGHSLCVDITDVCWKQGCPEGTICGLNLNESVTCFPESVKEFENCGTEELRLSQPCSAHAGIRGFGQGCTFCVGDNPFEPDTPPIQGTTAAYPDVEEQKACVVIRDISGSAKRECLNIVNVCRERSCPIGTICGLDLNENVVCFPESVQDLQNCESEEVRLAQPCSAHAGIRGFGQGCTFCVGRNPFGSTPPPAQLERACINRHLGNGAHRRVCRNINAACQNKACGRGLVCALNRMEQLICLALTPMDEQNCGSEKSRISRPCPAHTALWAYARGCNICRKTLQQTPRPRTTPATVTPVRRACLAVGGWRRSCFDISAGCAQLRCGAGEVCALNVRGTVVCWRRAYLANTASNCGSERWRLARPCRKGMQPVAFSAGCTYCKKQPVPTPGRICLGPRFGFGLSGKCVSMVKPCARKRCGASMLCVLNRSNRLVCLNRLALTAPFCGTEQQRIHSPCGTNLLAIPFAFGQGCNYCR